MTQSKNEVKTAILNTPSASFLMTDKDINVFLSRFQRDLNKNFRELLSDEQKGIVRRELKEYFDGTEESLSLLHFFDITFTYEDDYDEEKEQLYFDNDPDLICADEGLESTGFVDSEKAETKLDKEIFELTGSYSYKKPPITDFSADFNANKDRYSDYLSNNIIDALSDHDFSYEMKRLFPVYLKNLFKEIYMGFKWF
ncbi:MAG: hypothetical protein P1U46_00530 [Patescibacteria group bacterium]|nr:hypothetical protein [Patescibacteria group bacterium]